MTDFRIECMYELPIQLRALLGSEYLIIINIHHLSFHFGKEISARIFPSINIRPQYHSHENDREKVGIQLYSKGEESLAGNLYGIVAEALPVLDAGDGSQPTIAIYGPVKKIVGMGEIRHEVINVADYEDDLSCFFPPDSSLPDIITINKKTLEVIGFALGEEKWLYLFSDEESHFRLELESTTIPEELCKRWDYIAMEKQLQILEVFE